MTQEEHSFNGLLVGITTCDHGTPFITVDVNGQKIHLTPEHAELVIDTIYNHLTALGYYGEEEEPEFSEVRRGTH